VAGPVPGDGEAVLTAVIDLDAADTAQRRSELIRPRQDRRRDLYQIEHDGHRY
jgi:hypothetical protein